MECLLHKHKGLTLDALYLTKAECGRVCLQSRTRVSLQSLHQEEQK